MKKVYLTEDQVRLFTRGLEMIAAAIEAGGNVHFKARGGGNRPIQIPPLTALRNSAGWLRRTADEQNGGYHLVTAWDYPEER